MVDVFLWKLGAVRDKKAHGAANVLMNKADVFLFISPVPVLLGS